mgnify:CR=1 FL=1
MERKELVRSINSIVSTDKLEWEPWDRYFPGAPPTEGEYGGWVKVLRRPEATEKGWTFLFKWVGWPGKTVRHIAIVPDDGEEHVYMVMPPINDPNFNMEGTYTFRGPGARHGGNFGADFTSFLRYTTGPDIILSYEFVDRRPTSKDI